MAGLRAQLRRGRVRVDSSCPWGGWCVCLDPYSVVEVIAERQNHPQLHRTAPRTPGLASGRRQSSPDLSDGLARRKTVRGLARLVNVKTAAQLRCGGLVRIRWAISRMRRRTSGCYSRR